MTVLERMEDLWQSVIRDHEDRDKIDLLFIENGFPEHTPYRDQPGAEYCGHTAAHGFRLILPEDFLHSIFSSTTRLNGGGPSPWSAFGIDRNKHNVKDLGDVQGSDLVVVKTSGKKAWGDHIVIATSGPSSSGQFSTIEGNAFGIRGDGTWGKGVVKRLRNLKDVRQIYRF